jgi:hypothetical protein
MMIMHNTSGRRWARTFLALALFVSMVGNIAHTILADSHISLWLRVPGAVLWPLFTFGGIEIVVRMVWERRFSHYLGRNIILLPAIPAAIISYQHLYSLLLMMGEERFIAAIGPLAIDGMMIGCTMILLFTRPVTQSHLDVTAPLERLKALEQEQTAQDWSAAAEIELAPEITAEQIAPTSPAVPRAPRATSWDVARTVEMIVDGAKDPEIQAATGASKTTAGRFRKVAKQLQADPRASIDSAAEKVRAEHVQMIRELVSR